LRIGFALGQAAAAQPVGYIPWLNVLQAVVLRAMTLREIFSRNLQAQRRARGLSQEALAHEAEVDRTYLSALERCINSASLDIVERLARVLDVEPSVLLERPRRQRRNPRS